MEQAIFNYLNKYLSVPLDESAGVLTVEIVLEGKTVTSDKVRITKGD